MRSHLAETGGLLWGLWDDAVEVIWVFDLSGPPPDSKHDPAHFVCGVKGTREEHDRRMALTSGACGYVGHWHTHPDLASVQSLTDMRSMTELTSTVGQNQRRSLMAIFGRKGQAGSAGIYVYESEHLSAATDLINVGEGQLILPERVV
jgi:integrative and conjugative element protein (TIGR02256 family)